MLAIYVENRKWWMCISAVTVAPMIRWKAAGDITADFTATGQQFTYYNMHGVQTHLHTCTRDTRNVLSPDMTTSINCDNLKFVIYYLNSQRFSEGVDPYAIVCSALEPTNHRHRQQHQLTGHREDTKSSIVSILWDTTQLYFLFCYYKLLI